MGRRRCAACGERFSPCRHVPGQRYCSKPRCQRERRRRWQREKLRQDPDYQANQAAAQRRWCERHPDYWRRYRQDHPDYTVRNREQQRKRNRHRDRSATGPLPVPIAKRDVCNDKIPVASGTYRMIPARGLGIAKRDAYLVEIQVLSEGYGDRG
jgi:hypothetical protein